MQRRLNSAILSSWRDGAKIAHRFNGGFDGFVALPPPLLLLLAGFAREQEEEGGFVSFSQR